MFVPLLLGIPFLLAAVLGSTLGKSLSRWYLLVGLGFVVIVGGLFLSVYLSSAPDYAHSKGIDGEEYLGRWWDPDFTAFLVAVAYVGWMAGLGVAQPSCVSSCRIGPRKDELAAAST